MTIAASDADLTAPRTGAPPRDPYSRTVRPTPPYRLAPPVHPPGLPHPTPLPLNSLAGLLVNYRYLQFGFCVFVLSNYMESIPDEMYEGALVDGASLWTRYW